MTTTNDTWNDVKRTANDLREHWNATRAQRAQPGDSRLGNLIADLLITIAAHDDHDPMARLEAAERALLIAAGWESNDGEYWSRGAERECFVVAVTISRRERAGVASRKAVAR